MKHAFMLHLPRPASCLGGQEYETNDRSAEDEGNLASRVRQTCDVCLACVSTWQAASEGVIKHVCFKCCIQQTVIGHSQPAALESGGVVSEQPWVLGGVVS